MMVIVSKRSEKCLEKDKNCFFLAILVTLITLFIALMQGAAKFGTRKHTEMLVFSFVVLFEHSNQRRFLNFSPSFFH